MNCSFSVKLVRRHCVECSGDSFKAVIWCPCDGLHSTLCEFWPFRLGLKPPTVRDRYGDRLITPQKMPGDGIELELLPNGIEQAATAEINIPGYYQPAVAVTPARPQSLSPERRRQFVLRLAKGREAKRSISASKQ
ncbi:MAG: hypothetical protein ACOX1P_05255 [Thermoguttaceae bacterium]|jgi:hypothetical protein